MALRNQPYLPLYVQDIMTDEKLNECSASTHGVYIKGIMCLMHKSENYGKILLKQKYKQTESKEKNFALMLATHLPYDVDTIFAAIVELISEGVCQFEDDFMIQKRMVKDGELSVTRSKSGKSGGESTQKKNKTFALAKTEANSEYENTIEIIDKIKEGGLGETIKIDFIKSDKEPAHWQDTIKQFLSDFEFKKMCCSFYKCEWVELEDRMVKFIQGVHLKQNFQEIAALKVHFKNHYTKHYINGGLAKKEVPQINNAYSKGFIEAPKDFDYDQMENWSK
ncbi:MAG: hypothetical protein QG594_2589 [Bacteroidota bacterium]|nr:hypothetical protein [Bacteroidota bacterium]